MVRRPRGIWRRFKLWARSVRWITARKVAIVLAGLLIILTIFGSRAQYGFFNLQQLFLDMWANWSAELASIVITVWVIDTLNRRRAVEEEKRDLILQMGSPDNAFALEAVRKLRAREWHKEKALQGARLSSANLKGARLEEFDLRRISLVGANLEQAILAGAILAGAELSDANLKDAILIQADIQRAVLNGADLSGANLYGADLRGAMLPNVKLQGAKLNEADLEGASIVEPEFDTYTTMPDKTPYNPSDVSRFTDRNHSKFWRSDNSKSRAFRGKDATG